MSGAERRLVDLSHTIEHGTVTLKGFGTFPVRAFAVVSGR